MPKRDQLVSYYWLVFATFIVGLIVAIYPVPSNYALLRPEFLCLFVVYWVTHTPQYFGVFIAWTAGMIQDLAEGVVWGAHAVALSIVAYICLVAYQRIKSYSVWHQSLWVFILVGFHQVMANWVLGLAGYKGEPLDLIVSTTVSALFWPLIFFCISRIRLHYRMY